MTPEYKEWLRRNEKEQDSLYEVVMDMMSEIDSAPYSILSEVIEIPLDFYDRYKERLCALGIEVSS